MLKKNKEDDVCMNNIKIQLLKLISSRYFWLSSFISVVIVSIIQFLVFFGCKYEIIPFSLAIKFYTIIGTTDGGPEISLVIWRIPYWFEIPLFYLIFFFVCYQLIGSVYF
jgi:hypothetical protein